MSTATIQEQHKELIAHLKTTAIENFNRDGFLTPLFFIITFNDEVHCIPVAGVSKFLNKATVINLVKQQCEEMKAVGVLFIGESWTINAQGKTEEELFSEIEYYGGMDKHPGRREVVFIKEEFLDSSKVTQIPICREAVQPFLEMDKLKEFETGEHAGNMTNLLNKPNFDELFSQLS